MNMSTNPEKFNLNFEEEAQKTMETGDDREDREGNVELIEGAHLGSQDKMNLMLTYLREKPALQIEATQLAKSPSKSEKELILSNLEEHKDELRSLLDKLGLFYEVTQVEPSKNEDSDVYQELGNVFLASFDNKNLARASRAWKELKKSNTHENDKEFGLSLGFPKTAADSFWQGSVDYEDFYQTIGEKEKKELIEEGIFKFLSFRPSKDHWRKELNVLRRQRDLIREKSPNLYKEIISKEKDPFIEAMEGKESRDNLRMAKEELEESFDEPKKNVDSQEQEVS